MKTSVEEYKEQYTKAKEVAVWNEAKKAISIAPNSEKSTSDKTEQPTSQNTSTGDAKLDKFIVDLIETGALSDSFRACIAPYHGTQSSQNVLNFVNNTLHHSLLNYDQEFTNQEILDITDGMTKYDFDSVSFLNFSIVSAIIDGRISSIKLQDFLEVQGQNLTEVILFYDAYMDYCTIGQDGKLIQNLRIFTETILNLYPNDLVGHACTTGVFDFSWNHYRHVRDIFLKAMSRDDVELHTDTKQYCIKQVNGLCSISCDATQEFFLKKQLAIDDVNRINPMYASFKNYVIQNGLFEVNAANLSKVQRPDELIKALAWQTPTEHDLRSVLNSANRLNREVIRKVVDYIFDKEDTVGPLAAKLAKAISVKKLQIPADKIKLLLDNGAYCQTIVSIMVQTKIDKEDFMSILKCMDGTLYAKLCEKGKRPGFIRNQLHEKLINYLVEMGVVRIWSEKRGTIQVEVLEQN